MSPLSKCPSLVSPFPVPAGRPTIPPRFILGLSSPIIPQVPPGRPNSSNLADLPATVLALANSMDCGGRAGASTPPWGGRSDWAGLAIIRKRRRIASGPIPRFCIPAFPPTAYSPEPKACLFPLPYPLSQLYRAGMRNAVKRVPAETVCPGRGLGKTGGETLPPGKSPGLGRSPGNLAFALASPRGGNMTLSRTLDDPLMRRNARP